MRRKTSTLGKNPSAVRTAESFIKKALEAQFFHLKTTLDAHQKLATLSSNNPLANGKIRLIGSRMADIGANGGRKGRNRAMNNSDVTKASLRKSLPLKEINFMFKSGKNEDRLPVDESQI
jgi:hypothetical protein